MKYQIFLAALFLTSTFAHAKAPVIGKPDISCKFYDIDGDKHYGEVSVFLDKDGNIVHLSAHRAAIGKDKAHDFDFHDKDSTFSRVSKDLRVKDEHGEMYNPEGGPSFVEVIEAKNAKGERVVVRPNDHRYSGHPGSTFLPYVNGKLMADPGDQMGDCEGKIMYPDEYDLERRKNIHDINEGKSESTNAEAAE